MLQTNANSKNLAAFIWSVADLLRGDFKQSQYGRVILPFTVLRRFECTLEPTKTKVLETDKSTEGKSDFLRDELLCRASGQSFYNTSSLNLSNLGESDILSNLESYVQSFSKEAREIFDYFRFSEFIESLSDSNLLYRVVQKFANIDLSPKAISNYEMGLAFEELIRRFAESSNETAGEHFTPRDIVQLTTLLVLTDDDDALTKPGTIRTLYDPTAGTGGFLSTGMDYLREVHPNLTVRVFGQELNPESYAICKADMMIKGQAVDNIKLGNTLSDDQLANEKFNYLLANPPFGVDWKKTEKEVKSEHKNEGYDGRFGPGLPRISDGSLLFLLHLVSKMRSPDKGGSRIGIILNGSPLFTGGAGSGESEIRRYLIEHDLVEAIIGLPTDMFYNTGIATYIWILSNRKPAYRKGKVQLIDATEQYAKMRKSLGSKRHYIPDEEIEKIVKLYGGFEEAPDSKIFDNRDFGYRRITIERPLRLTYYPQDAERRVALTEDKEWQKLDPPEQTAILDALDTLDARIPSRKRFEKALGKTVGDAVKLNAGIKRAFQKHLAEQDSEAELCKKKGKPEPSSDLRDYENVPLAEDIHDYFAREVAPHVPDAWIDESKRDDQDNEVGIVGYEIPFNRHFYVYEPPRSLEAIDAELDRLSSEIMNLLQEVHS